MRPRLPGLPIRGLPAPGTADRQRGSMSVELAVVIPALLLLLLIVALGGRLVQSQGEVDGAARDAARAASLGRTLQSAEALAQQAAGADLPGATCEDGGPTVTITDGAQYFDQVAGTPPPGENVTVTVTCEINTSVFSPLLVIKNPFEITGIAVAPLDPFMCRGPQCTQ
jgi:Flp pilus assembly protein TadG